jgi:hypothetical protein
MGGGFRSSENADLRLELAQNFRKIYVKEAVLDDSSTVSPESVVETDVGKDRRQYPRWKCIEQK